MLIVFDDMIPDMESNKKLISIVTKVFVRGKELNISLAFIRLAHMTFIRPSLAQNYKIKCNT